jgi:putative acetyltransferase
VFLAAVTETAANDYSAEQLAAWARPDQRNLSEWDQARGRLNTFVAVIDTQIAGFSDVGADGYIDMLFVSPRYGRRGVGGALLSFLEERARTSGIAQLSADVSITARQPFERRGFTVEAEQHPLTAGVRLTNFRMTKDLRHGG